MNATSEHKDFPVSWEEVHRDTKALAWRLQEKGPWQGIVAVTRGGLVPACILARELEILHVETICISSYDYGKRKEANILKGLELDNGGEGWIIADDLVDSGETFKIVRDLFPKAHRACVYAKPDGAPFTDTFVTEVSQDTWIIFPWESGSKK